MFHCGRRIRYNNINNRINGDLINYIQKTVRSFHGYPFIGEQQQQLQLQLHRDSVYCCSFSSSSSSQTDGVVVVDDLPKDKPQSKEGGSSNSNKQQQLPSLSPNNNIKNNKKKYLRLPVLSGNIEFPNKELKKKKYRRHEKFYVEVEVTKRKLRMAISKVLEPPTLHLLSLAATATLTVGLIEGTLICNEWPFFATTTAESWDATKFVLRYSLEQLFPSVVWMTQDPHLVATALNLDPTQILRDLSGNNPESASLILQTQLLASSRSFFAGFMMIAHLVRAASVSIDAFAEYRDRIRLGKEPPIILPREQQHGLVIRLCGMDSFVTEASMKTMGIHIFPVFEDPVQIQHFIWKYSENYRRPVYWHVRSGLYGSSFSWSEGFPANKECFFPGVNVEDQILILEADATNGNDPLMLEGRGSALDLTIDDASQGFRRILDQYESRGLIAGKDFRTLRVYLGNSTEIFMTGGGHCYTLRHRIKYAKEFDVLLDSRAPVLQKILDWCDNVCDDSDDRKIFFQTSSRKYFVNVKELLKEYGYEVIDPLDLRMIDKLRQHHQEQEQEDEDKDEPSLSSLMSVLLDDEEDDHGSFLKEYISALRKKAQQEQHQQQEQTPFCKREMLRTVARMSKLPRLIHFENTSQTVNAVEALIAAGEIQHGGRCCALIDRQEGVLALERTLHRTPNFVEYDRHQWNPTIEEDQGQSTGTTTTTDSSSSSSRLQIICSSSIHNDLFRKVRLWARMGYSSSEIQYEVDTQYKDILNKSYNAIQQETTAVTEVRHEDTGSKKTTDDNHDGDKEKLAESSASNPH